MVYCRDQVDRRHNRTPELTPKVLLDAFLEFKIPAQIPLGVRSVACVARSCEQHGNFLCRDPKYDDKAVSTLTNPAIVLDGPEQLPSVASDPRPIAP